MSIPKTWLDPVIAILDGRGSAGLILVTKRARNNWANLDRDHYEVGLYAVLSEQLKHPERLLRPSRVVDMDDPGECYDFSFLYRPPNAAGDVELYAKINLLDGGLAIKVYSAHT